MPKADLSIRFSAQCHLFILVCRILENIEITDLIIEFGIPTFDLLEKKCIVGVSLSRLGVGRNMDQLIKVQFFHFIYSLFTIKLID